MKGRIRKMLTNSISLLGNGRRRETDALSAEGRLLWSSCSWLQIEMDRGSKDERKHHGAKDAADHSDGQRLQHGGTSPDAESQRKHAGDGGQRRHSNGAQAAAAGLDHGFFGGEAEVAEAMLGIQEENAVFSHNADNHDHTHARSDIEGGLGDKQGQKSAETG